MPQQHKKAYFQQETICFSTQNHQYLKFIMKKNLVHILVCSFVALFFASCQEDKDILSEGAQQQSIIEAHTITTVDDSEGNSYPVIKIGTQYWIGANLKSTTYSILSEASNQIAYSADKYVGAYYNNPQHSTSMYDKNMTEELRNLSGYHYSWEAAMGIEENDDELWDKEQQKGVFRQGICPNGYHIPTEAEWNVLIKYIEKQEKEVGDALKANFGWANDMNGTNSTGFSALPTSYSQGEETFDMGRKACFWTATPNDEFTAKSVYLYAESDGIYITEGDSKNMAMSVRCVKDVY